MRPFLKRLVVLVLLFWLVNSAAGLLLRRRIPLNLYEKHHWIMAHRGESYGVAVLGSSRALNNTDAVTLQSILKKDVINLGAGGSNAADQYLILHQFLQHNRVDLVALQVDYLSLTDYFTYGFRDYIWYCYQQNPEVRRVLRAERGELLTWVWDLAPFVPLMQFGSQYRYFLTESPPQRTAWDVSLGSQLIDTGAGEDLQYVPYREDSASVSYLRCIADLCRRRDVGLLLFQSPLPSGIDALTDRRAADLALLRLSQDLQVPFLDSGRYFDERPLLFCDRHHLNREGALEFSRHLAEQLQTVSVDSSPRNLESGTVNR